jgi:hypothetical protein
MQLPTEFVKLLFERVGVNPKFFGQAKQYEVICIARERLDLSACRAEVRAVRGNLAAPARRASSGFRACLRHTHPQ